MKFAALCNEGFEEYTALEVTRLISIPKSKIEIGKGIIYFDAKKEDIVRYIYLAQSPKSVLSVVESIKFKDDDNLSKQISKLDLSFIDGPFCARSNETSKEKMIGSAIYEILKDPKVDLKYPSFKIYAHILDDECLLGLDISEVDLSKRSYKIFTHPSSIKGTLAYFMLAIAGYDGSQKLLDPCMGSATINIEAALLSGKHSARYFEKRDLFRSPFFDGIEFLEILEECDKQILKKVPNVIQGYDISLPAVTATKKNLKIAGIDNFVSVGRGDVDWLETKFEEKSVDLVVTHPTLYNQHNQKKTDKFYDIFFYQIEYLLADNGKIVVLTNSKRIIPFAEKFKIGCTFEKEFMLGANKRYILTFEKSKK